ncbi:MAG: hypothetical protein GF403_11140 [Candidatus Coatesbacteria bacterium]|nr:hypothetical protein [Candidatus Coatesbacteria bacterium]
MQRRLPQGTPILSGTDLARGGIGHVLRVLGAGGFSGYLSLNGSLSSGQVLIGGGRPLYAGFSDGIDSYTGAEAAALLADAAPEMTLTTVQLDKRRFHYARIILFNEPLGRGFSPTSEELILFYSRCVRGNRSGLIQMYNDDLEYYIHILRGEIVDKPSSLDETFDAFRGSRDYLVDTYFYEPAKPAGQILKPRHFDRSWLRGLLVESIQREFGNRADALVDELKSEEVLVHQRDAWLRRIEKFLRNFICGRMAARTFVQSVKKQFEKQL